MGSSRTTEVTRRLEFDAGHRVFGHEGKCAHLHGHRYVAEVTAQPKQALDGIGRVVDFSVLKAVVGTWIDNYWDHNILLSCRDPLAQLWQGKENHGAQGLAFIAFGSKPPFIFDSDYENPTAECMARCLYEVSVALLATLPIVVTRVRIYETPNCWADWPARSAE